MSSPRYIERIFTFVKENSKKIDLKELKTVFDKFDEEERKRYLTMKNKLPFGKYKNKPVEILKLDKNYVKWLRKQPELRERYTELYSVIDTPEYD